MTTSNPTTDRLVRPVIAGYVTFDEFVHLPEREIGAPSGICQAMQIEISGRVDHASWTGRRRWQDFPWVTLVVGSGPVGLPDSFWANAHRLHDLVLHTLRNSDYVASRQGRGLGAGPASRRITDMYLDFSVDRMIENLLDNLRRERVGEQETPPYPVPDRTVTEFAAGLVLAAAQLTRVFHLMSVESSRPVARRGTEQVSITQPQGLDGEVDLVRHAIDYVQQRLPNAATAQSLGQPFVRAVNALLMAIIADLHFQIDYTVRVEHLRQLTDLAWQCLVWDICGSTFPGWTELLLDLVLIQNARQAPRQWRLRWRALNELSAQIAQLIRPASEASWDESLRVRQNGHANPTRDFYDSAATLLWQQTAAGRAARRGESRNTAAGLPHAVAFVTSFDLELEMALLRTRPADEEFISIVMPVYLWQNTDEGEFFWLEGIVKLPDRNARTSEVLHALTHPVRWRAMYQGRPDLHDHPVIVRLTGSPLMDLAMAQAAAGPGESETSREHGAGDESLRADLRALNLSWQAEAQFVHSATVDEYLALRQAEAEAFWVYARGTFANMQNRALPKALLACREPGPIRFWLVVGVPFSDPAVRLRVLSQMSSRRFMLMGEGDVDGHRQQVGRGIRSRGHDIAGLAVNWRLDDDEAVLLITLGMQVIHQGRAEDLSDDLRHHSWHLGAFAAGQMARAGWQPCPPGH